MPAPTRAHRNCLARYTGRADTCVRSARDSTWRAYVHALCFAKDQVVFPREEHSAAGAE
ncbi:hypothetical protein ACFY1J_20385 [Streptomyces sp. NPDC001406]|uniref:hypothetical protein n=1 Tax=Streptomyces sp. NPDC001406 TaxID=3364572 RepID=UPI0036B20E25